MEEKVDTGKKILFIVYYAGHSCTDGGLVKLTLDKREGEYPLEAHMKTLSTLKNVYMISIYDSCRNQMQSRDRGLNDG